MLHKFLQTILLFVISSAVNAQTLKSWTWDSYKMKFKAPDNMVVRKSDATVFEASNNSNNNGYLSPKRREPYL